MVSRVALVSPPRVADQAGARTGFTAFRGALDILFGESDR